MTALPSGPAPGADRRRAWFAVALGLALLIVAGCTAATPDAGAGGGPVAAPTTPPPPPPAACLLDTDALATGTGLSWTPDVTTASDTRCVYDPGPAAPGTADPATGPPPTATPGRAAPAPTTAAPESDEFVAVDIAEAGAAPAAEQLDVLAQVCDAGSRTPTRGTGFVCRLAGGSVFAGLVHDDEVVTVAASAVPPGTSAAALVVAFGQQLDALA